MTRSLLDKRVKMLMTQLSEMGSLVEKQIYNSIEAFRNKDMELAKEITENDDKVDELNRKIEEQCLKLMAMESKLRQSIDEENSKKLIKYKIGTVEIHSEEEVVAKVIELLGGHKKCQ